jgi:zinc protease
VADIENLRRSTLENGLDVLLYPSSDAPVASFWVFYRVGSRNELPGITGVSHWVEHMMFKGTPNVGPGELMLRVNRNGGELNAFTSYDYTAYHQTLPADRIGLAVDLEADRMVNLLIDPGETDSERTVILSERQGAFNNPSYVLWDETVATAFRAHSYREFVIGSEHDLKTMNRDDLYGYYRRFYAPNNAVVVVSGAFDADAMQAEIERAFGSIPASDGINQRAVVEPPQIAERRVELLHPAPVPEVLMGFHVPGAGDPDTHALELLAAVLSGAGGRMGKSSRLPRALVATGKARSASANYLKGIDPFLFILGATGLPDGNAHDLDQLLMEQLALIKEKGIPAAELDRAKKQLITSFHYGSESVSEQAHGIGDAAMYGTPDDFFTYPDDIAAVTLEDVQRVVAEHFRPSNRTVGYLIPTEPASGGPAVDGAAALRFGLGGVGAPALQPFGRETLPSGITLLTQPQPLDPVVSVRIRIETGSADDPADRHGLAHVTAQMLLRGTGKRSREAFEDACDDLGASIGVSAGREHTEFAITCLAEDLPACLGLVADALENPIFDLQQLELTRREAEAAIKQAEDNTMSVADQAVRELIYPDSHPLRHRSVGDRNGLKAIGRDDLAAFHRDHLANAPLVAAAVGGFASTGDLAQMIARAFGDRRRTSVERPSFDTSIPGGTERTAVVVPGKEQTDIAMAIPVAGVSSGDYYDLDVANIVLGQFGMMGRIGDSVRQKQGLAYYAFCTINPRKTQSLWFVRAGVDPANVDRAIESVLEVLREAEEDGLTADELDGTRQLMTGRLALTMQTNAGIASLLMTINEFDLGLDYVERYPSILAGVTLESAREALARAIDPGRLQIAVAGPATS